MQPIDEIIAIAARRKGGMDQLEALLATSPSLTPEALAAIPPDRLLAAMTKRIFYAGFSWTVIDNKWPAFEQAFMGFDPHACAFMPDETLEDCWPTRPSSATAPRSEPCRPMRVFCWISHASMAALPASSLTGQTPTMSACLMC